MHSCRNDTSFPLKVLPFPSHTIDHLDPKLSTYASMLHPILNKHTHDYTRHEKLWPPAKDS